MNNDYMVKLEAFEGPLNLLLHLIKKNEVDIYDIPIASITEEYIQAIETMKEMNLDVAGEFLVMASTLIYIKSRMLLPVYRSDDDNDETSEDPREELVRLLVEYQRYQQSGKELGQKEILGRDVFKHQHKKKTLSGERSLEDMELFQLIRAYQNVIDRYKDRFVTYDVDIHAKSLQDKILELIEQYPDGFLNIALEELVKQPITKNEIIVSFLSVLELVRLGFLKIIQVADSWDILLTTIKPLSLINKDLIRRDELFKEMR